MSPSRIYGMQNQRISGNTMVDKNDDEGLPFVHKKSNEDNDNSREDWLKASALLLYRQRISLFCIEVNG